MKADPNTVIGLTLPLGMVSYVLQLINERPRRESNLAYTTIESQVNLHLNPPPQPADPAPEELALPTGEGKPHGL